MSDEQQVSREAGRALDAEVAEKIFGASERRVVYEWRDRTKRARPTVAFLKANDRLPWKVLPRDFSTLVDVNGKKLPDGVYRAAHYSTEIAAAWEVVEKMRADGWVPGISWDGFHGEWLAQFDRGTQYWSDIDVSAPTAICTAALEAVAASTGEPPAADASKGSLG